MKNKTLLFVTIASWLMSYPVLATVRTVSNNPDRPAQFAQVDAAIAAAAVGDTIYVHGSQFTYSDFSVTKRLVIIGSGYNSNNQFNLPTTVNMIYLNRDTGLQNASGTVITGFMVTSQIRNNGNPGVDNVVIFRNKINSIIYTYNPGIGNVYGNGWVIYNNIINQVQGGSGGSTTASSSNITIQNNIFTGSVYGFSMSSVVIDHNVFQGSDAIGSYVFYATITNNIFVRTTGNAFNTTVSFNTFNNNLSNLTTISPTAPTNSFLGNTNSGAGNFVAVDPLFVNVTNLNSYVTTFDYRLQVSSTVRNAGTDGTDLGIYGGARPFPSGGASGSGFDTSALPPIPQVTEVNILNATLQPGTPLNVNVKAKVNN
jgi:hypothetical protein